MTARIEKYHRYGLLRTERADRCLDSFNLRIVHGEVIYEFQKICIFHLEFSHDVVDVIEGLIAIEAEAITKIILRNIKYTAVRTSTREDAYCIDVWFTLFRRWCSFDFVSVFSYSTIDGIVAGFVFDVINTNGDLLLTTTANEYTSTKTNTSTSCSASRCRCQHDLESQLLLSISFLDLCTLKRIDRKLLLTKSLLEYVLVVVFHCDNLLSYSTFVLFRSARALSSAGSLTFKSFVANLIMVLHIVVMMGSLS